MKRTASAFLIVLLSLMGAAGVALGDEQGSGVTGCLTPGGTLTNIAVGDAPLRRCSPGEIEVHFGGRLSCPDGTILFVGVCIENTARPPANHSEASADCAADGRRLPSGGELEAFRMLSGITLATGGEWTDDLGDVTLFPGFAYLVVTQAGNGVRDFLDSVAYRCVAGPQ